MLTIKEKIDLLESKISRANFHWSFLFTINLAVVGWTLSNHKAFCGVNTIMFVSVLLLTYIFIFWAIIRAQREMILLEKDIVIELTDSDQNTNYLRYLKKYRFQNFIKITWPVYWIGNILVIAFLIYKWGT